MPGNRCSNCIAYNFDCLYVEAAKVRAIGQAGGILLTCSDDQKRGPPKGSVRMYIHSAYGFVLNGHTVTSKA